MPLNPTNNNAPPPAIVAPTPETTAIIEAEAVPEEHAKVQTIAGLLQGFNWDKASQPLGGAAAMTAYMMTDPKFQWQVSRAMEIRGLASLARAQELAEACVGVHTMSPGTKEAIAYHTRIGQILSGGFLRETRARTAAWEKGQKRAGGGKKVKLDVNTTEAEPPPPAPVPTPAVPR